MPLITRHGITLDSRQPLRHPAIIVGVSTVLGMALLSGCDRGATSTSDPLDLPGTQAHLEDECQRGSFSGVVRVRSEMGQVFEFTCGEGITPTSLFKVFSTSKQITAAVIMAHVDAGTLRLDDRLIDQVSATPEAWRDVTISSLLQHRSGIPDLTGALLEQFRSGSRDHAAAVTAVLSEYEAVTPPPNPDWQYNNFGYELLTLVAESADDGRFEEQAARLIFEPAGMTGARFELVDPSVDALAAANIGDLVPGYNGEPDALTPAVSYSFVQRGAGGLHMSARDLSAYLRAYRSNRLFSDTARTQMTGRAHRISDTVQVGLGWFLREAEHGSFISHSGGTNGYISLMGYYPEHDLELAIVSNYGFAQIGSIREAILADIHLDQADEAGTDG